MGALGETCFAGELDNCVDLGCVDAEADEECDGLGGCCGAGSGSEVAGSIEEAVRVLLKGLGEDCNRDGLRKTPARVAKAFRDGTRGYKQKVNDIIQGAMFQEAGSNSGNGLAGGVGGLVAVRDISLFSYCESCLLPFRVQCHVGYISSGQRVVGLSKLARVADIFAKRLQSPQRLADEVCSALQSSIKPAGVAVALQCWHIQLPETLNSCFNIKQQSLNSELQGWHQVHACSNSGVFEDETNNFWIDFLAFLKFRGVNMPNNVTQTSSVQAWCPLSTIEMSSCNGHLIMNQGNGRSLAKNGVLEPSMIAAVTSILRSIGEDPSRNELLGTPYRFMQWLMRFKSSTLGVKLSVLKNGGLAFHANGGIRDSQECIQSELNMPFCAQCEHHLLPFHGVVHVGYLHTKESKPLDRCLLESIVQFYGCKLQVQERLTRQIAETIFSSYPKGVIVAVEASHICMISRGIEKIGSSTATVAVMGRFSSDPTAKAMFLQTILEGSGSQK